MCLVSGDWRVSYPLPLLLPTSTSSFVSRRRDKNRETNELTANSVVHVVDSGRQPAASRDERSSFSIRSPRRCVPTTVPGSQWPSCCCRRALRPTTWTLPWCDNIVIMTAAGHDDGRRWWQRVVRLSVVVASPPPAVILNIVVVRPIPVLLVASSDTFVGLSSADGHGNRWAAPADRHRRCSVPPWQCPNRDIALARRRATTWPGPAKTHVSVLCKL